MAAPLRADNLSPRHRSVDLETLFKQCFYSDYKTLLMGGADEPLYSPAASPAKPHCLYYRADYFASALHEIAHWCVAGAERRLQEDWGYWYCPDGRSPAQQRAFEAVEIAPQAIEWMFSVAAAAPFRISRDNLLAGNLDAACSDFHRAVAAQVQCYRQASLPPRAAQFFFALSQFYGVAEPLSDKYYCLEALL
ncbi:MAG: elongation factor P hydroxylase [Gammaproteobacteria bacterium]|nr:elongation factor P hydroxylase [Gammaproteobacteria bacterium]MBQ0840453.1 elongation factor P hydroxylase [Gammaproteobacteria bacterium]